MEKEERSRADDSSMKRIRVPLSESEKAEIEGLARKLNMSVEDLIIKAVKTYGEEKKK